MAAGHPPAARTDFVERVRDALGHVHDYVHLQTHPLAATLAGSSHDRAGRGRALSRELLAAVDALRPAVRGSGDTAERRYQVLVLRYLEGLGVDEVAARLAISRRQFYNDHNAGVDAVASLLAERRGGGDAAGGSLGEKGEAEPADAEGAEAVVSSALPAPITSLVGRVPTILQVSEQLRAGSARLVTLTGPPGTGKTRLAIAVARLFADEPEGKRTFPDGVWFIDLAPLNEASQVLPTVLQALGLRQWADRTPLATLIERLRDRRSLLVLDNFEHVLAAAPDLVALARASPRVTLLLTSRSALALPDETAFSVPPMTLPATDGPTGIEGLTQSEAVRLFVERAKAARSSFELTAANGAAIARICRTLDGLPLAIELAAARVRVLSAEQIAMRLDDRFAVLGQAGANAPRHQRGLRAAMDWSYALLTPAEQLVFRRLSVFAGGCELDAAQAVCDVDNVLDVLDVLDGLVERSLVVPDEADGAVRYRMLETMRQYGVEKLRAEDDEAACRDRHIAWCTHLGEEPLDGILDPARVETMARELDNIRAALGCCRGSSKAVPGLKVLWTTFGLWYMRGLFAEARDWLQQLSALAGGREPSLERAGATLAVGQIAISMGDLEAADALLSESYGIAASLGNDFGVAQVLHSHGNIALYRGDLALARGRLERAREINRRDGRPFWEAFNLGQLARTALYDERLADAETLANEGLALARGTDNAVGQAMNLRNLGDLASRTGNHATARERFEQGLAIARRIDDTHSTTNLLIYLADDLAQAGESERAAEIYRERLRLSHRNGMLRDASHCLQGIAALPATDDASAVKLLAVVQARLRAAGIEPWPFERTRMGRRLERARRALGAEELERAWQAGDRLSIEEAVEIALSEGGSATG